MSAIFPLLGNQLFPLAALESHRDARFVLVEDHALCSYVAHHQHKLVLILAAMRAYAHSLREAGFEVIYRQLDDPCNPGLDATLGALFDSASQLRHFEFAGRTIGARIHAIAARRGVVVRSLPSPMFVNDLALFDRHCSGDRRPHMARYYRAVRRHHGLLLEADGAPRGGRWSFDGDNRKRLPAKLEAPALPAIAADHHVAACIELVARRFPSHPGDARRFAWPTTRAGALAWLDSFLNERFADFGAYEDAITQRSASVFHSLLSPLLNLGLLTPHEVLERALRHAEAHAIPLNSVEGFVRQLVGWREFVRGVYLRYGRAQAAANHWQHHRRLGPAWYSGDTGITPLDDAIRGARDCGWNHHIQRLMVIGNLMLLSEIAPRAAYHWFMEMYVDAYGWVMEPNVYGMALYSDGGVFATKPYICASNYLLKMSDYARGPWCDTLDGLYWRFVARHRTFFENNFRLRMTVRNLDRIDAMRRQRIDDAAERFLREHTLTA